MKLLPSVYVSFLFLLACNAPLIFAAPGDDGNQVLSASVDDVIRLDDSIEPVICELLSLDHQLASEIRNSGIDARELMARDANDNSPVVRNIRRISQRVQEIQTQIAPTTRKLAQMVERLSAAERGKVDSHRRGTLERCRKP